MANLRRYQYDLIDRLMQPATVIAHKVENVTKLHTQLHTLQKVPRYRDDDILQAHNRSAKVTLPKSLANYLGRVELHIDCTNSQSNSIKHTIDRTLPLSSYLIYSELVYGIHHISVELARHEWWVG